MLFGLLLEVLGCASKSTSAAPKAPRSEEPGSESTRPASVESPLGLPAGTLIAQVSEARELEAPERLEIVFHDEMAFAKRLAVAARRDGIGPTVVDSAAFQLAFGFGVLANHSSPPYAKTQRDHMIAFFDSHDSVINAKEQPDPDVPEIASMLDLVIAHEIGHALQTRHFSVPDIKRLNREDERLAALAVLEGDAMLTMLAYQARKSFIPLGRALVESRRRAAEAAAYGRKEGVELELELERMPTLTRTRLEFPYAAGLGFMGALYRTGGFELVNRVYTFPPVTTEQVLHPERYLEGDAPIVVEIPAIPAGYEDVSHGTVGELLTSLALSTCIGPALATEAAEGWGGDSFRLVEKDGLGSLLWATVWDTAEDAREFEMACVRLAACWEKAQASARSIFAGPPSVVRRANRVAVQRGILRGLGQRVSADLLELPRPVARKRPPFGPVRLRPMRTPPKLGTTVARAGRVVAPSLGLSVAIPKGYGVEIEDTVTLFRELPSPARVVLSLSGLVVGEGSLAITFAQYVDAIQGVVEEPLRPRPREVMRTPLGDALVQLWNVGDGEVTFRLWVIPICRNTGAVLVAEAAPDDKTRGEHEKWLGTLRRLPDRDAGLCAVLDP